MKDSERVRFVQLAIERYAEYKTRGLQRELDAARDLEVALQREIAALRAGGAA